MYSHKTDVVFVRMEELRPVLVENAPVAVPGFRVLRLALNQHMPRVEKLSEHRHGFHQALLYLRGRGTQHLGPRSVPVARGDWLAIPPGRAHRFEKEKGIRPVCLAIDFETDRADFAEFGHVVLRRPQLAEVERLLVDLNAAESRKPRPILAISALVLGIAALLEESLAGTEDRAPGPTERAIARTIEALAEEEHSPAAVAARLGVTLDHLNRRLRDECGQTVGAMLRQRRLDEACRLLRETDLPVGEIADRVGLPDQNYFGRWFRKYAGQTPSGWRRAVRG